MISNANNIINITSLLLGFLTLKSKIKNNATIRTIVVKVILNTDTENVFTISFLHKYTSGKITATDVTGKP